MDLLTVVMRELGKEYLKGKERLPKSLLPLLEATLSPAVRRLIDASKIDFIIPESPVWTAPVQPALELSNATSTSQDLKPSGASQGGQNLTRTPSPQLGDNLTSLSLGTIPPGE